MNFLAIDTSSEAQVLGLKCADTLIDRTEIVGRQHSQLILPAILQMLDEAHIVLSDLDGIVFGQGPGSFTGLRIAIGVVQGLGFGLDIPVVGVSTLAVLAQGAHRTHGAREVVVALHAREREVYFGSYRITDGLAVALGEDAVVTADDAPAQPFAACIGVGDGWVLQEALQAACRTRATTTLLHVHPTAVDLLALGAAAWERGETMPAMRAEPRYLRERVATPKAPL